MLNQSAEMSLSDWCNGSKDDRVLIPRTHGHVTSQGRRDFADVIKDPERGRLSCCLSGPSVLSRGGRRAGVRHVTTEAEVRESDLQCLVAGRRSPAKRSPLGLLEGEQTRLRLLTSRMIDHIFAF